MYSMGYPFCYDPSISSTLDENENFVSASFDNYWITASRLIDYKVLNTDNKVYKMTIVDYRDNYVALGVKTSDNVMTPYMLQLLDYDGNLLWSINTNEKFLEKNNGAVSKKYGVLAAFSSDRYKHYTIQGELNKEVKTEELRFDLN